MSQPKKQQKNEGKLLTLACFHPRTPIVDHEVDPITNKLKLKCQMRDKTQGFRLIDWDRINPNTLGTKGFKHYAEDLNHAGYKTWQEEIYQKKENNSKYVQAEILTRWRVNAGKVCGWRHHAWTGVYYFKNPVTFTSILDAIYEQSEEGEAFPCAVCRHLSLYCLFFSPSSVCANMRRNFFLVMTRMHNI